MEYYVGALDGTRGVSCAKNELPCVDTTSSLAPTESGDLTKLGKYTSPTTFEVSPEGNLSALDMNTEYLFFSNEVIDKNILDTESTENFYYYQDVFKLDEGKDGSLWKEIYDKLEMQWEEQWLVDARKNLSLIFVKNEEYYLKQLQSIKMQIEDRFVTDSGTITEGLNTTTDSIATSFVSEDKERKCYYDKSPGSFGAQCNTFLLNLSLKNNSTDNTFNWKYNKQ